MLAAEVQADLLILMSDVDGIYTAPPWVEGARLIHTYTSEMHDIIRFGKKSKVGTGGMDSKVRAMTFFISSFPIMYQMFWLLTLSSGIMSILLIQYFPNLNF